MMELVPGVHLHVLPNRDFATTHIQLNFTQTLDQAQVGSRVLASNMVETVSANLPSQRLMAQAQSKLYGADFSVDVLKTGQLHTVRASLILPNDEYLPEHATVLSDGLDFLRATLLEPMGDPENGFDPTIFNRQKEIALDELAGLQEDRQYFALRQAMQSYFAKAEQSLPAFGSAELLEAVDQKQAYEAWQLMLANDRVDIIVFGNVDEALIVTAFKKWRWSARTPALTLEYSQPLLATVKDQSVRLPDVSQARLVLGYQLVVAKPDRFIAYVFNTLFGGHAISRLFMNVREEAGLAYAISSDYNLYTGLLLVEAGVEVEQLTEVKRRIAAELMRLQTVLVEPNELATIKRIMMADYSLALDQPSRIIEREFVQALTGQFTTSDQWLAAVEAVTAQDIQRIAQATQLQLNYELIGGNQDATSNA